MVEFQVKCKERDWRQGYMWRPQAVPHISSRDCPCSLSVKSVCPIYSLRLFPRGSKWQHIHQMN